MGARYRERGLRTAVWPILQNICANTGVACNRWNRLLFGKQTGLGQRRALVLAAVAMQLCYLLSAAVTIFMDNIKPAKAPSEEFL